MIQVLDSMNYCANYQLYKLDLINRSMDGVAFEIKNYFYFCINLLITDIFIKDYII